MAQTTHGTNEVAYDMPFEPYAVQKEMMHVITNCLQSSSPVLPVAAVEVPTGCGKTLALLSCVLRYQATLEKLSPLELEQHMRRRRWKQSTLATLTSLFNNDTVAQSEKSNVDSNGKGEVDDASARNDKWKVPPMFFKRFRPNSGKRLRVELDDTSGSLRRQHEPPPCNVFYVTRTHSQLRQSVGELRKLCGLHRLKMNILGSRERYCINHTVLKARANKTLPVEGNNLGEVCDKLVSLGQCECVHNYSTLASRALSHPLCRGRQDRVWDMEDLAAEGVATQSCPYYASRDLVFFTHITFATYQYLLDPLIRHECKMEAALKNHSIVIFDEAHHVPLVCQEALSLDTPVDVLRLVISEIEPLVSLTVPAMTLSYPREFKLTHWTLVQLFSLLHDVFKTILEFLEAQESVIDSQRMSRRQFKDDDGEDENGRGPILSGDVFVRAIQNCILEYLPLSLSFNCANNKNDMFSSSNEDKDGAAMFRQVYSIVMSLGVTFNPFQFSIFALSIMKRWLLVIRFMLQKPSAFVISIHDVVLSSCDGGRTLTSSNSLKRSVGIRCLDGSLAFHHLLEVTHRVVLASGTLAPFHQLGKDLGVPLSIMATYEGVHVVDDNQYRLFALTHTVDASCLHCTYVNLTNASFIDRLVSVILPLVEQVRLGGVLVFLPNYNLMREVWLRLSSHYRGVSGRTPQVFVETKAAAEFFPILDAFRTATSCGTAVLVSVYRAKVSEGIDFANNMTRLVICVGVPLRPLRSWTVVAQRRYNGEEWYVIDAVREVNQAIGRCLRNRHDYGAMVLLDDRFGQEVFRKRLSRWCRDKLKVHYSPATVVKELHSFYGLVTASHTEVKGQEQERAAEISGCLNGDHEGPLVKIKGSKKQHSGAEAMLPFFEKSVKRSSVTTCTHEWGCTAVKLLYEAHEAVERVSASDLRDTLHLLEDEYLESRVER